MWIIGSQELMHNYFFRNLVSIKIKYMPILLGGLLKLAGAKANVEIPLKAKYMVKDCKLWAEKYNIDFKFNNYFPIKTLNLMRCTLIAEKKKFEQIFIDKIFDAIWKHGMDLNDNTIVEKLLKNLDLNIPRDELVVITGLSGSGKSSLGKQCTSNECKCISI